MQNKKKTITEKIETKTNSSKIENHFCASQSHDQRKNLKNHNMFPFLDDGKKLNVYKTFTLREKRPCSKLFSSAFSHIRTEYWEILSISPYSVWMWEKTARRTPNTDTFYAVSEERLHWWRVFLLKLTFFNDNMKIWYKMKVCLDDKTDSFSSKHIIL